MSGKAWTVLDKVTIAYRGETYEIGRGRDYFGIWTVAGSRSQPLEWGPETQEGWAAAWTRAPGDRRAVPGLPGRDEPGLGSGKPVFSCRLPGGLDREWRAYRARRRPGA